MTPWIEANQWLFEQMREVPLPPPRAEWPDNWHMHTPTGKLIPADVLAEYNKRMEAA